ncbi:MAG: (2Fe-2S)-binding protein [Calothrix sp. SM1_5_4]|nr:(2Fe-2S)-binding protein [Calothrix sp. SM1_5_4]
MPEDKRRNKEKRLICLCNRVSQTRIETAIAGGCNALGKIFDATSAGVGPCGGSCQPILKKMLESYAREGTFPDDPRPPSRRRGRR